MIDEVTESFFAAPLLSIDETVLRAFPVDPFDVARTRRRPAVTVAEAEALVAAMPRFPLDEKPVVRTQYTPPTAPVAPRELAAPAVYCAAPEPVAAPVLVEPIATVPSPVAPLAPPAVAPVEAAPASRGWLTGGLLAMAGLVIGSAFVCAALTRTEARIEPMPSVTAAISR